MLNALVPRLSNSIFKWSDFGEAYNYSRNGKEFTGHEELAENLSIDYFFAHPYHSWERGSNENLNGLIRQYFPKGSDFTGITEQRIKEVTKMGVNTIYLSKYSKINDSKIQDYTLKKVGKLQEIIQHLFK